MKTKKGGQPILVPVDFSRHSEAALLKACELAECSGNPILVLHVIHDPAEMPGYYGLVTKKTWPVSHTTNSCRPSWRRIRMSTC